MANFPNSYDTDASLFVAVNNKRTTLTSNITDSTTTIPVVTTSGFPSSGYITILSDPDDITQAEAIKYVDIPSDTTFDATGGRGAGGTLALPHNSSDNVDLTIVADHHNELKNAVVALEHFVGTSGTEKWPQTLQGIYDGSTPAVIITSAGNAVVISGSTALIVSGTLLADDIQVDTTLSAAALSAVAGTFSNTLTLSGEVVATGTTSRKGTKSFVTSDVTQGGGTLDVDEPFNNRSLVRRLTITPESGAMDSMVYEFFMSDSYVSTALEYQATSSGTYTDNDTWFHEDEDRTEELHLRVTNNSSTTGYFTVELTAEVFG